MLEEPTSPAVRDQPRGRLLFGAVLGSFAVIAALVASAAAGATAMTFAPGTRSLSTSPTPVMVPPVSLVNSSKAS